MAKNREKEREREREREKQSRSTYKKMRKLEGKIKQINTVFTGQHHTNQRKFV